MLFFLESILNYLRQSMPGHGNYGYIDTENKDYVIYTRPRSGHYQFKGNFV